MGWTGGIESRWGQDILHLSRQALGHTQPPVQWVPSLSRGKHRSGRDADPSLPSSAVVKKRAIPLLPLWAVRPVQSLSACTRVHLPLPLHEHLFTSISISRWILLMKRNVSDKCYREHQDMRFILNNVFPKLCCLWDNVEKYCWTGQATYDNRAHTFCILDTQGYRHTLRIWNTYFFFTATTVTRMRRNVTFLRILPLLLHVARLHVYFRLHTSFSEFEKGKDSCIILNINNDL
jgi:hypothetical protein